MSARADLIRRFRELLHYDGKDLYWKPRTGRLIKSWNATFAGKKAGCRDIQNGYLRIAIDGRLLLGHRVIWAMHYGKMPEHQIDHINGDRFDNRIENLRDVPLKINMRNLRRNHKNTSGVTGVYWNKQRSKWHATITVEGVHKHIGHFDDLQEAAAARAAASAAHDFHENHGKF